MAELIFSAWNGFLEGFYNEESLLVRSRCLGESSINYVVKTMELSENLTKENFLFSIARLITNVFIFFNKIRSQCLIDDVVQDVQEFCIEECTA